MGNKSEKTFADLFSNSDEKEGTATQTFSDILNNSNKEEQKNENQDMKETTSKVTFDSLFDKMAPIEEEKKSDQIDDKKTNLFSETNQINSKDAVNNKKVELKPVVEEKKQNEIFTEFNPFLENTMDTNIQNNQANEKKEEANKNPINNPFINNNNSVKLDSQELNLQENNLFSKEEEKDFNPFFNQPEPINKEEKSINKDKEIEITNQITSKDNQEKLTDKKEENISKSSSPFFSEEIKQEENPFFQNNINLIENKVPSKPNTSIDTTKSKHYNVKIVKKKEPLIKFILGVLSYAIFIWLLLIGITLLIYVLDIKIRAAKGDYSSPTFNAYVVLTGSMLPEIQVNDVVITKKVDAKDLKEGDVITFASADSRFLGTIITHRIIKKYPKTDTEGYTFKTQGDNNNVADNALVPENNIYGKVILKIPKLGYLQEFLASDGGWIIVILIPCLTVISYDIVKLIKGLKRKKYKNIKVQK